MKSSATTSIVCLVSVVRTTLTAAFLLFLCSSLQAENPFKPGFLKSEDQRLSETFKKNPFVALPGQTVLAPDPNQLRFQDLRGVECYAQPDRLEVCGAPDTLAFLLFTKSTEDLENISINVKFDEGLESFGFAFTPEPDGGGLGSESLDTISVQNPESPTFFLNEIRQGDGAVVVYVGVRAECGVDFDQNPPNITYTFNYTAPGGVPCELIVTPEDSYGGDVIVPKVAFNDGAAISNALIRNSQDEFCQNVTFTQTTPTAQASGAIFTVEEYGQDMGIEFSSIQIGGQTVPASDYTVDATSGVVTVPLVGEDNRAYFGGDGLIDFSEDVVARVCYTTTGCVPNDNIPTRFSVVSACDGELCTGPVDFTDAFIDPAYNSNVDFARSNIYRTISTPAVCGADGQPVPYVFEVDITGRIDVDDPVDDALTSIIVNIQACSPSPFASPIFEVVTGPGTTAMLDEAVIDYLLEDRFNSQGNLTNPAGTILLDLRNQRTDIGGGLTDVDGDTFFDDIAGGDMVTLRITFPVTCGTSGAACITPTPGDEICQFNRIRFDGRRRCDQASQNETILLPDNPEFRTESSASFSNETEFDFPFPGSRGQFDGFDFDRIGATSAGGTCPNQTRNFLPAQTRTLNFEYTIGDGDFAACPADSPGDGQLAVRFAGDPRLLLDMEFSNVIFEGAPVADADTMFTYSEEEGLTFLISTGNAAPGTYSYSFDITLDTNYCSPPQLVSVDAFLQTACSNGCDCEVSRSCSSTVLRVDPTDVCCLCIASQEIEVQRQSTGFTDATRTQRVDPDDVPQDDQWRFVSGDTMRITYKLFFDQNQDLTEYNNQNRLLSFSSRMYAGTNFNNVNNLKALWDYRLARVQVAEVRRVNGDIIRFGDIFSGPTQNREIGLRIGSGDITTSEGSAEEDGEVFHPAFPNGGYQFGTGDSSDDKQDGHNLSVEFTAFPGRSDAITPLKEALGGGFVNLDTVVIVWDVPMIDNPGFIAPARGINITAISFANSYVGPPANNIVSGFSPYVCNNFFRTVEYESPQVFGDTRIDYLNDCDAEIVSKFELVVPDNMNTDNWFSTEWRPINGIERMVMDLPSPYFYDGGATIEAVNIPAISYEPDSTLGTISALLSSGDSVYYPTVGTTSGQLVFNDSELEDGVRADAYDDFDNGDNDITTIGGDFPLIAFGLGPAVTDSLIFRVPVSRLCGVAPPPASTLRMQYQAASRHLADYNGFPYRLGRNPYWTNVPDPMAEWYFPYDRLDGEFLNPHRQELITRIYSERNVPTEFMASASLNQTSLTDTPGQTETTTYTLSPGAGDPLEGVLTFTVDNSVELVSLMAGGAALTPVLVASNDSTKIFSVELPPLAAGAALELDIETDLLFCDEGMVCISALVPCGADPATEVLNALNLDCGDLTRCFMYQGGVPDLQVAFAPTPSQDICNTRPLSVSFTNNGSSIIADFSPVLFIPEGVEADETSFVATVMPGGASMPLAGFANDPALDDVFGLGYDFPDGSLDALLGADGLNPGETLTLDFMAETSCMITSGLPLAVDVDGLLACGDMLDILPVLGPRIDVNIPDAETPNFEFNVDTPIQLSCGEEGTEILLTALQLGKVDAGETQICFRLPVGTRVEPTQIRPVSPEDFIVDPATIERTPIGTMGGEQVCFPAPAGLRNADFFCLNVPVFIDDIDCGERAIGVFLTQKSEVDCNGMNCEIDVLTSAMPYLPIEVVPPVSLITAELEAECTGTPGVFNVPYTATVSAPTEDFFGVGEVELVFDLDGNGERDSYDIMVGATQTVAFDVPAGEEVTFSGTFENIDQSQLCPLLLVVRTEGCACDEKVLAFPTTVPDFLADVGEGIALCPGDDFTLTGICAPFTFTLAPANAGTIVDNGDETITISLNDGFGLSEPVQLQAQGGFGNCTEDIRVPIRTFEEFSFPDQTISSCSVGCQEVDLNIPASVQSDLMISVTPTTGVEDPNSPEPKFCDLQQDMQYTVTYTLNNNGCSTTSLINVVVFEQPTITLNIEEGCSTGFSLTDNLVTSPPGLGGDFDSNGDGFFTPTKDIPGDVNYIPGPEDIRRGFVRIDFQTEDPDGPCGPALVREVFNLKIVDCGTYPWNGGND